MRTAICLLLLAACGAPHADIGNEAEVITTVVLTFTPAAGAPIVAPVVATFDDPDGEGGGPPIVDPVSLSAGTTYALAVQFQNRLEDPPEEITDEVRDEGDEHQVFFTGTAVGGPLAHRYADTDARGLPVGLASEVTASAGTGTLTVTLRHLPPLNDTPVKTADLAARAAAEGFAGLPGETDAQVNFAVTVP